MQRYQKSIPPRNCRQRRLSQYPHLGYTAFLSVPTLQHLIVAWGPAWEDLVLSKSLDTILRTCRAAEADNGQAFRNSSSQFGFKFIHKRHGLVRLAV